jgi:hypothetical protein
MVDFRKWLFALAAVGLLLGIGSASANAQGTMTCTTSAGVPNIIRAEGVTELLGDLIINCVNGTPTPVAQAIPLENFQITVNANITSRIVGATNLSEAVLMIDEPFPVAGTQYPPNPPGPPYPTDPSSHALTQLACQATNSTNCAMLSKGEGVGSSGNYDGTVSGPNNGLDPPGLNSHYNIFQGFQNGLNAIAWDGVPLDAPGTAGVRVIRITNVRANAFALGVSSTLVPTSITMLVSVNGSAIFTLSNAAGNVVGIVEKGLTSTVTAAAYQQCNNLNSVLLGGTGGQGNNGGTGTDLTVPLTATEGFAASFKPEDYAQFYGVNYGDPGAYIPPPTSTAAALQNIPGFNYVTETGFYPGAGITGLDQSLGKLGLADHGTQIQFTLTGIPTAVSLFAPGYVYMTGAYGTSTPVGLAVLVGYTGTVPTTLSTPAAPLTPAPANVPVSVSGGSATVTYEVWYADPSVQETMTVNFEAAWLTTGPTSPPPTTGTGVTVATNFAPLSTVATASTAAGPPAAPLPRFGQPYAAVPLFTITPCTCNLLFPFVTNIAGFDTGVAIANTTADPYGTPPQSGTVVLNYYGTTTGGGAAPATQTTTSAVPAGSELIFTISNGGNYGIVATPGFEGYMIAVANFQYCHGFAFISDSGAQKLAEGYLAIQLDAPGLERTNNIGENKAH